MNTHRRLFKDMTLEVFYEQYRTERLLARKASKMITKEQKKKLLDDLSEIWRQKVTLRYDVAITSLFVSAAPDVLYILFLYGAKEEWGWWKCFWLISWVRYSPRPYCLFYCASQVVDSLDMIRYGRNKNQWCSEPAFEHRAINNDANYARRVYI